MSNDISIREHKIIAERKKQLKLNVLVADGGRRYITQRLWRAPNESDLSWNGRDGMQGRPERATLVNDASRVVNKINQYLFKQEAERAGIDDDWRRNVTGKGQSINSFFAEVSEMLTTSQWLWVQVSKLGTESNTLASRAENKDFARWTIWPSLSVPDWSFSEDGKLRWIITEELQYVNVDPFARAEERTVRTLWQIKDDKKVYLSRFISAGGGRSLQDGAEQEIKGLKEIPFVLIGKPSERPWWFDDVENMQAMLMNIDSLNAENLTRSVFPQLVIPASMLSSLQVQLEEKMGAFDGKKVVQVVRELTRALDTPIVESTEDKGITRFITPNAGDLKLLPDEIATKRQTLFEMVGLSLFGKETRQTQTAESKEFDQLDTESTLQNRALIMQEAEEKLVELSKIVDPAFSEYQPNWPASFDVVDIVADMQVVTMMGNLPDVTPSMRKLVMMSAIRIIQHISGRDTELVTQAQKEVKELKFDDDSFLDDDFFSDTEVE